MLLHIGSNLGYFRLMLLDSGSHLGYCSLLLLNGYGHPSSGILQLTNGNVFSITGGLQLINCFLKTSQKQAVMPHSCRICTKPCQHAWHLLIQLGCRMQNTYHWNFNKSNQSLKSVANSSELDKWIILTHFELFSVPYLDDSQDCSMFSSAF